jgi:hypothetical protein
LPPFQNNVVDEVEDEDDTKDDPAVHLNDSESSLMHVTQHDYEDALISNQFEEGDVDEVIQKEHRKKFNIISYPIQIHIKWIHLFPQRRTPLQLK